MADTFISRHPSDDQFEVYRDLQKNKDVSWEKEGAEFHYKGVMYDVAKREVRNGQVIYYCYNDKRESKIFSLIENLVSRQSGNSNTSQGNAVQVLLKLLAQVYVPCGQCTVPYCSDMDVHNVFYGHSAPVYPDHYRSVMIPPPKVV